MIELSILELLYLVLIFFVTIIGTLLIVILVRVLKVLGVVVEITNYYWEVKRTFQSYIQIPLAFRDRILRYFFPKDSFQDMEEKDQGK